MKKRFLSLLLVIVLIVSVPAAVALALPEVTLIFNVFEYETEMHIADAEITGYIDGTLAFQLTTDNLGTARWRGPAPPIESEMDIHITAPGNYVVVFTEAFSITQDRPFNISPSETGSLTLRGSDFVLNTTLVIIWDIAEGDEPPPPPPIPFTDVPEGMWFFDSVVWAYENNIMRGATATTFEPLTEFTRCMNVATLFRMHHGRTANESDSRVTPFEDVREYRWYAPYIAWAFEQGIVNGQTATTFGVGEPVTRQDFATLMYRYANFVGVNTSVPTDFVPDFSDVDIIGPWAEDAMAWVTYTGIIRGSDGELLPWNTAIRAEAAAILMRYISQNT